jgi:hypothetical protein
MRKTMLSTLVAIIIAATTAITGIAEAQIAPSKATSKPQSGVLSVTYYNDASSASLSSVRVVNQSGKPLCALFYVTDHDQEQKECCGCEISNDGAITVTVAELTNNPVNGVPTTAGSIALISSVDPDPKDISKSPSCEPTNPSPSPQLLAWSSHLQNSSELTEDEFTPITLKNANLGQLVRGCKAIELVGSGRGLCTCPDEG